MMRMAFNRQLPISREFGSHVLMRAEEGLSLTIRVAGLVPAEDHGIVRLIVGEYVLPVEDIDPYLTIRVESGQPIVAVCQASSVERALQLTGYKEDHRGSCKDDDDPFITEQDLLDKILEEGLKQDETPTELPPKFIAVFTQELSPIKYVCKPPASTNVAVLMISVRYAIPPNTVKNVPKVQIKLKYAGLEATYIISGPKPSSQSSTVIASRVQPLPFNISGDNEIEMEVMNVDPAEIRGVSGAIVFGTHI